MLQHYQAVREAAGMTAEMRRPVLPRAAHYRKKAAEERPAHKAKNVSRETNSGCLALKMFHVKHYALFSRFFCSSQTLSMATSAGDTPAMRLA